MATDNLTRKLAAIVVADIVGYSRLMEADESGTLTRLKALREELIDPKIATHRGRIVKTMGGHAGRIRQRDRRGAILRRDSGRHGRA